MIGRRQWERAMERHAWRCVLAVLDDDPDRAGVEARKADLARLHWRETCELELAELVDVDALPEAEPIDFDDLPEADEVR